MPEFRIISKSFKKLTELEEMLREIVQKRNNEIKKDDDEYGVEFEIINPKTRSIISFYVYNKEEFTKSYNSKYGGILQINWSSKMPSEDIDFFMIPFIKELREYLPDVLIDDNADNNDDLITIDEYIKKNEM
jgi:hypothetical protein